MSSPPDYPFLGKHELFARLGEGASARVTVLTPNRRLASALAGEFDAAQAVRGRASWETADILSSAAFTERLYENVLYSGMAARLPLLLSPAQEQLLWEDTIARSEWGAVLLAPARTAEQARNAWTLAHQWRIDGLLGRFPGNEDASAFAAWATHYRRRTEEQRHIDAARLPDLAATLLGEPCVRRPDVLALYAFDILTPQMRSLICACVAAGTRVFACRAERREAQVRRLPLASAREEFEQAANWARARLETAPGESPRIGIVVPDLELRRKELVGILSRVLRPGFNLPGAALSPLPFNVSMGTPLAQYPLVHAALGVLALALGGAEFPLVSRLVRSPFLGGAQSEATLRARLDAALRGVARRRLTLAKLIAAIGTLGIEPPLLLGRLRGLFELVQVQGAGRRPSHEWAVRYSAMLKAVGFPGERTPDSTEYQTLAKWHEALGELAALSRVSQPMSAQDALARLSGLCRDMLFQPESGAAPIQVLGVLESAGLQFDYLWICGLTDEAWPLSSHPNPFIPPALQKKAGVPEASADTALELDRRITRDWLGAAAEVVISHALRQDDRELLPSPLIADLPERAVALPAQADYRDALYASRVLEALPDASAPPVASQHARGGSRVLADQSACPFRAFATHRLAALPLETPADGFDAAARGTLLHALMKGLWDMLKTQAALQAASAEELAAIIERAAAAAVASVRRSVPVEERFAALEQRRLAKLAREWFDIERARPGFAVVACEDKRRLAAGGLVFSGRIDRMDRLEDGTHALIDYKTGPATPRHWEGERPHDPQLPLYAVNAEEPVSAIVFAKLKTGGMRLMGYSRDKDALPGVKQYRDWDGLFAGWKAEVDRLGSAFAAGEAAVDPKHLAQTCRYCELQPLCRVHERFSTLDLEANGATGETEEPGE